MPLHSFSLRRKVDAETKIRIQYKFQVNLLPAMSSTVYDAK